MFRQQTLSPQDLQQNGQEQEQEQGQSSTTRPRKRQRRGQAVNPSRKRGRGAQSARQDSLEHSIQDESRPLQSQPADEILPEATLSEQSLEHEDESALHQSLEQERTRRKKKLNALQEQVLQLQLQHVEDLRREKPYTQPQTIWAERICALQSQRAVAIEQVQVHESENDLLSVDGDGDVDMAQELVGESNDASKDLPGVSIGRQLEAQARAVSVGRHQPATVRQYEPHIASWRAFCSEMFDGNDVIEPVKVAAFLQRTVFERFKMIILRPSKPYSGVIGLTKSDPQEDKAASTEEANVILARFQAVRKGSPDSDGGIRVRVPLGMATVEAALKALTVEWRNQKAAGDNKHEHPRQALIVDALVQRYKRKLVADKVSATLDRAGGCPLRDGYSLDKFAEMMAKIWLPIKSTNRKKSPLTDAEISTRFSLSARHQMCLRDEDIRGLDLADCFAVKVGALVRGSASNILGMVFSLSTGKTVTAGTTQFASALRHKDYIRCCVGAFAFHMFERFHMKEEPFPEFEDAEQWPKIKALRVKCRNKYSPTPYRHQLNTSRAAFALARIQTSRGTHASRHAGILEAEGSGLNPGDLAHLGRWNHDKMTSYYLSGLAIPGAFANAGFKNDPYVLDRDCLAPPLALQRMIFPEIESQYPSDAVKWIEECNDIMAGIQRSAGTIAGKIFATNGIAEEQGPDEQGPEGQYSRVDCAKYSVLCLLLKLRRVILQDAVMFFDSNGVNPLLRHHIFSTSEFLDFKTKMLDMMHTDHTPLRQFQDVAPDLVEVLELTRKEASACQERYQRQLDLQQQQISHLQAQQEMDHERLRRQMEQHERLLKELQAALSSKDKNTLMRQALAMSAMLSADGASAIPSWEALQALLASPAPAEMVTTTARQPPRQNTRTEMDSEKLGTGSGPEMQRIAVTLRHLGCAQY